jgi:hypothetical protein
MGAPVAASVMRITGAATSRMEQGRCDPQAAVRSANATTNRTPLKISAMQVYEPAIVLSWVTL